MNESEFGFVPCFTRDGVALDIDTMVEVSPQSLMLRTCVADANIEVHSSFALVEGETVAAAHLIVEDRQPPKPVSHNSTGDPARPDDRRRFMLEHLGYVRDAVVASGGGAVTVELEDISER